MLEAEPVELERRRSAALKTRDHRLAAAGISAHRVDGDGIVRRQQPGIDQRSQQRHRAGRITAGIGNLPCGLDLVGLVRRELGKAIGPVGRDAERGGGVEHPRPPRPHAVDQRDRFLCRIVRQTEDDEIDLLHQRPLGGRILALLLRDALHCDVVLQPQPLGDAEASGAGAAIDEHGRLLDRAGGLLMGFGETHHMLPSSEAVSLVFAAKACGRTSRISCAMVCEPWSGRAASPPATAA